MTITIAHTGDVHLDDKNLNRSTPDGDSAILSHARTYQKFITESMDNNVSLAVSAGDITAHGHPTQETVMSFYDMTKPLVSSGVPFLMLEGNHEKKNVRARHRTVTRTMGSLISPYGEVYVVDGHEPELIRTSNGIQVVALPWLSKMMVLESVGKVGVDPKKADKIVADYAMKHIEALVNQADPNAPLVMFGHVSVDKILDSRGSEMDVSSMLDEPVLSSEALMGFGFSYIGLSHIHNRHRVRVHGDDRDSLYYAGSPDRLTFTDAGVGKSFNMVYVADDNTREKVKAVATGARLMADLSMDDPNVMDKIGTLSADEIVRLTLSPGQRNVDEDVRKAIESRGAWLAKKVRVPVERSVETDFTVVSEDENVGKAMRQWLKVYQPQRDEDEFISTADEILGGGVK